MNTASWIALFTAFATSNPGEPGWQGDYYQAQKDAATLRKPVVVVFGSGTDGWNKVVRSAKLNGECAKLLAEHYICVYVDTSTAQGQKLARIFDITASVGIVISSRGGASQAFWHQGDVADDALTGYLRKYSDPKVAVFRTETTNTSRYSFYPSVNGASIPSRTITTANC